jgi:hypothetical protein
VQLNAVSAPVNGISAPGGTVVLTSNSEGVCTVSGFTLSIIAVGVCSLTANQSGTSTISPAPALTKQILIVKASTSISFSYSGGNSLWHAGINWNIVATASSGASVSMSAWGGGCTLSGNTMTITSRGLCGITATSPETDFYLAGSGSSSNTVYAAPTNRPTFIGGPGSDRLLGGLCCTRSFTFDISSDFAAGRPNSGITNVGTLSFGTSTPLICSILPTEPASFGGSGQGFWVAATKRSSGTCEINVSFSGGVAYIPDSAPNTGLQGTYVFYQPSSLVYSFTF